ncbi:MAG: hypothetical protein WAK24_02610 [Candidatus Acidiferrales bacterium]
MGIRSGAYLGSNSFRTKEALCGNVLCGCILFILPVSATSLQRAKPPGIVTADQQSNQPVEPPMEMRSRKMNVDQVKQEADELKKLADGVPAQIELVTKNQYPKDLTDNLKRIERLAKHLRSEVTP